MAAAQEVDDFRFGVSADADVLKEYEVTGDAAVILLKKFDDPKTELKGDITSEAIVKFVKTESLPLVIEFNHESAQKIFGGEVKNHLLIFVGKSHADAEKITSAARGVAKDFKGKVKLEEIFTHYLSSLTEDCLNSIRSSSSPSTPMKMITSVSWSSSA